MNGTLRMYAAWVVVLVVWALVHVPAIRYGTYHVPLHTSYIGDEQSPVYGALHMLERGSLLGLRNEESLYYGPVFALITLPAVVADYGVKRVTGAVRDGAGYANLLLWDWGGVLVWARTIATATGFLGLVAMYLLFRTRTLNPAQVPWVPWVAVLLLGTAHLYSAYAAYLKHWVFVVVGLLWQLYGAIRVYEDSTRRVRWWVFGALVSVATFGISYVPVLYQVLWLPLLAQWVRNKDTARIREFAWYGAAYVLGCALVVWWHPYAFVRILGIGGIGAPTAGTTALLKVTSVGFGSFIPYALVIMGTAACAVFAGVFLAWRLGRAWWATEWAWALCIVLPLTVNYVAFSMPAQHVSRYMLPTVALCVVFTVAAFAHTYRLHRGVHTRTMRVAAFLLTLGALLGVGQLVGWERMVRAGPPDRRILPELLAWNAEHPEAGILVAQHGVIGYPHTKAAYERHLTPEEAMYTTWQRLLASEPPQGVPLLDIAYLPSSVSGVGAIPVGRYDHVVMVRKAPDMAGTSDTAGDVFDVLPWAVWSYAAYQDVYTVIK